MARDPITKCPNPMVRTGPYRLRPPADPELQARLDETLSTARSQMRSARREHRLSIGFAAFGYIAAALLTSPPGGDAAGVPWAVVWSPVAAGATCALVRAGRAGTRTHDLEAEIEDLERLSETLARTPG
jgi:hypothetical protein